jgi:hypothetical protein
MIWGKEAMGGGVYISGRASCCSDCTVDAGNSTRRECSKRSLSSNKPNKRRGSNEHEFHIARGKAEESEKRTRIKGAGDCRDEGWHGVGCREAGANLVK